MLHRRWVKTQPWWNCIVIIVLLAIPPHKVSYPPTTWTGRRSRLRMGGPPGLKRGSISLMILAIWGEPIMSGAISGHGSWRLRGGTGLWGSAFPSKDRKSTRLDSSHLVISYA